VPWLFVPLDVGATRELGTDVALGAEGVAEGGGATVLSVWKERGDGKTWSSAEGVGGDGAKVSGAVGVDPARRTTPGSVTRATVGLSKVPWLWATSAVSTPEVVEC
jgi:hypothetical protein